MKNAIMSVNDVLRHHGSVLYVVLVLTISSTIPASSETLRDQRGRVIGHLREEASFVRLTDSKYKTLGYYLRNRNTTVDAQYKTIGRGNQLGRLLNP